eukprot:NODE_1527_length_1305_cov_86.146010_g1514_i0.p1 GENE.NODE_1527_length_1305_cov_86.146010_g1514_i0~~NODE_1527_length_1305_cov_86.146010_g1514_i0.p1  ORF type:complete len:403 (+),score=86.57 NODE_1527_length_1305_cov_86.146010_g1514_i0:87-1211(+)
MALAKSDRLAAESLIGISKVNVADGQLLFSCPCCESQLNLARDLAMVCLQTAEVQPVGGPAIRKHERLAARSVKRVTKSYAHGPDFYRNRIKNQNQAQAYPPHLRVAKKRASPQPDPLGLSGVDLDLDDPTAPPADEHAGVAASPHGTGQLPPLQKSPKTTPKAVVNEFSTGDRLHQLMQDLPINPHTAGQLNIALQKAHHHNTQAPPSEAMLQQSLQKAENEHKAMMSKMSAKYEHLAMELKSGRPPVAAADRQAQDDQEMLLLYFLERHRQIDRSEAKKKKAFENRSVERDLALLFNQMEVLPPNRIRALLGKEGRTGDHWNRSQFQTPALTAGGRAGSEGLFGEGSLVGVPGFDQTLEWKVAAELGSGRPG